MFACSCYAILALICCSMYFLFITCFFLFFSAYFLSLSHVILCLVSPLCRVLSPAFCTLQWLNLFIYSFLYKSSLSLLCLLCDFVYSCLRRFLYHLFLYFLSCVPCIFLFKLSVFLCAFLRISFLFCMCSFSFFFYSFSCLCSSFLRFPCPLVYFLFSSPLCHCVFFLSFLIFLCIHSVLFFSLLPL